MSRRRKTQLAFDPHLERMVVQSDPTGRMKAKLSGSFYAFDAYFCELCENQTEYSVVTNSPVVVKKLKRGNAKLVPLTDKMIESARARSLKVAERYRLALSGKYGPYEVGKMLMRYCDSTELRADYSYEGFLEHIEPKMRLSEHSRHGDLAWPTRLSGSDPNGPKPSKLYCEHHNPRRSTESRRAYQRDRRFIWEYRALIEQIWSLCINNLTRAHWDIEDQVYVRREAYRQVQAIRSSASMIHDLISEGTLNQSEIARKLGISRQAVSAAVKKRAQKKVRRQES
ncbi:MarR family transcriptional regulator [Gluconobacter cerevisiae]|uniref:MarR family transcriptional regulator n=1 Tax=Gluconobacter cerevisiae TaxID=1379734 RepID=A0ABR9YE36_9PROT|nr:helix-turn-helix domain-containing protein [Gluconobacter cerevisiae]MBF0876836.1 MarR family transcriptional regulator [Gluconobacter cerevisiae]